jgi:uncharacterized membrane protein YhaH (DUF805 family)
VSTVNPYTPPRADIADIVDSNAEQQEPTILSASGRIGRLRYLAYLMGAYLLLFVAMFLAGLLAGVSGSPVLATVLMGVGGIAYFVFAIMTAVQRVHDMDWSGWSVLLALIPVVNLVVGLIWLFKGGTQGANRFGPPPTPNNWGVIILGCLAPVAFVGIMAAVAITAYQGYVLKAKAAAARNAQ